MIWGNLFYIHLYFASAHSHIPTPTLSCGVCNEKFRTEESRIDHLSTVHENINLEKCEFCENAFLNTSALANHQLSEHKHCMSCNKTFSNRFKQHFQLVHEGKIPTNRCPLCKDVFFDAELFKVWYFSV